MRNSSDLTEAEINERIAKYNHLLKEPYRKALNALQAELFHNPDSNEWKADRTYGMTAKAQKRWDEISKELDTFRKNKYPESLSA